MNCRKECKLALHTTLNLVLMLTLQLCLSGRLLSQEKKDPIGTVSTATDEKQLAAALVAAKSDIARATLLERRKELKTAKLVQEIKKLGIEFFVKENYAQALSIFLFAMEVARQIGDEGGTAQLLDNIGSVYYSKSDDVRALKYYRDSLKLKRALKDRIAIAATLNNIANVLHNQGNYVEALRNYRESLSVYESVKNVGMTAKVLNNIAIVLHDQGEYVEALKYYQKSLDIKQSVAEEDQDKEGIAKTLNNISSLFFDQGNYIRSLERLEKSRALYESLDDKGGIAIVLANMGPIYHALGNYSLALDIQQKSLEYYEEAEDPEGVAVALNNIGNALTNINDYKGAEDNFRKSIEQFKKLDMVAGMAGAQYNLARVLFLQKDYQGALANYQQALSQYRDINEKAGIADTLANMAELYNSQKNYRKALTSASRAITLARRIDSPLTLWSALTTQSVAYRALKRPLQARKSLDEAINIIETLRTQVVAREQEQQRFLEDKIAPYHEIIDLLIEQNEVAEALSYAERAKGRVLLDVIHRGRINISKNLSAREQDQQQELLNNLTSLNAQVLFEKRRPQPDALRLADLIARQLKARLAYEAFQTNLYAIHAGLERQRGETPIINLAQVNDLLSNTQDALLEYVVTEENTYLFVLIKGIGAKPKIDLKLHTIKIRRDDLRKEVERLRGLLAMPRTDFTKSARNLYRLLLLPVQEQLKGDAKITIVPDDVLWEIPFEALQSDDGRYVLESSTISYVTSLTVLRETLSGNRQDNTAPDSMTLLAVGNPFLGAETVKRINPLRDSEDILESIPYAEDEVRALERLYGTSRSKAYIGPAAREKYIKEEAGNYRILHFATHSIFNNSSPMYSNIVLAQLSDNAEEDGILEAWEIINMNLHADLAVLSACETARGHIGKGEGIIGLTWAFFVAGCPATVVSQWKVADISTAKFMERFHRNLTVGMTRGEALMETKKWMIKNSYHTDELGNVIRHDHPFYWAPFVLVGKN